MEKFLFSELLSQFHGIQHEAIAVRIFIFVMGMLFVSSGNSQTIDGFKGYKWGTSFEVMKDRFQLTKDETSSLIPHRQLNGEWVLKDSVQTDACWYETNLLYLDRPSYSVDVEFKFYQNRFCAVKIRTSGDDNVMHLVEMWKKAYGKGNKTRTHPGQKVEYYSWFAIGKDSQAVLTRYIGGWTAEDGTYRAGNGVLTYFSKSIDSLQHRNQFEEGK